MADAKIPRASGGFQNSQLCLWNSAHTSKWVGVGAEFHMEGRISLFPFLSSEGLESASLLQGN